MYNDGIIKSSVKTVHKNEGNCRRDARILSKTSGVVRRADW